MESIRGSVASLLCRTEPVWGARPAEDVAWQRQRHTSTHTSRSERARDVHLAECERDGAVLHVPKSDLHIP
eukprot:129329-Rhodomonas_salina.1